jgi:hypothetical protein
LSRPARTSPDSRVSPITPAPKMAVVPMCRSPRCRRRQYAARAASATRGFHARPGILSALACRSGPALHGPGGRPLHWWAQQPHVPDTSAVLDEPPWHSRALGQDRRECGLINHHAPGYGNAEAPRPLEGFAGGRQPLVANPRRKNTVLAGRSAIRRMR